MSAPRTATVERRTRETAVTVTVDVDGQGDVAIRTGLGFLDHLIEAIALHGRLDLRLEVDGDLEVDDHHTVEDAALVLGTALDRALGDRGDIRRFASAYAPLDESLARAVVDWSGRPWSEVDLGLRRPMIGTVATENIGHFFRSLATAARLTLHLDILRGENDHHRAEAAAKAFALALRASVERDPRPRLPSTKGTLS